MPRKPGPRGAAAGLTGVVGNLQAAHAGLLSQRKTLDTQIAALEGAMRALSASPTPTRSYAIGITPGKRGGGRRGIRPGSLTDRVRTVLNASGRPMRVMEITNAVLKGGFKTKNQTLDKSVGITVRSIPGVVKIGRGVFQLRA